MIMMIADNIDDDKAIMIMMIADNIDDTMMIKQSNNTKYNWYPIEYI